MRTTTLKTIFAVLGCFSAAAHATQPKLEDFERRVIELAGRMKSATADMYISIYSEGAMSLVQSEGKGTFEYAVRDGKRLSRTEMTTTGITTVGENETRTEVVQTIVGDGKYSLIFGTEQGTPMAFKVDTDPLQTPVPSKAYFDAMHEKWILRVTGDDKFEGHDVWVVEAAARDPDKVPAVKMISFYRKDCGVMVKTDNYSKMGRAFMTNRISNLKLNPDIKLDRFEMKSPEGVPVTDATADPVPLPTTSAPAAGEAGHDHAHDHAHDHQHE